MPRVNRCSELLGQGQPIYYVDVFELGHTAGVKQTGTCQAANVLLST